MTWRRPHWRERPNHLEDDPRPHEVMRAPTLFSSRALARVISRSWNPRRMEDACFFHQQANRCYQLAWQCFDLTIAHKLNAIGNAHTAKAREFRQERR